MILHHLSIMPCLPFTQTCRWPEVELAERRGRLQRAWQAEYHKMSGMQRAYRNDNFVPQAFLKALQRTITIEKFQYAEEA